MLFKIVYWLVDLELLFSASSIAYHSTVVLDWWRQPVFILYNSSSTLLALLFILVAAIASVLIFMNSKYSRSLFVMLWFIVSNINNKVFCTLSGGDLLFQHLLFFTAFLSSSYPQLGDDVIEINKIIHNTGVVALRLQLCVVYLMAGYTKILDSDWIGGTAVSDIFKIYDYNIPAFYDVPKSLVTIILNYTVIVYQLFFPVLVWIKKIKKWYLVVGIIQHLFIAFVFGLPTFGLVMVISYSVFWAPGFISGRFKKV